MNIGFELTDRCNLTCSHCYMGESGKTNLGFGFFEYIYPWMLENKDVLGEFVQITGGEPTLNPDFEKIVGLLQKDFRLSVYTNGVFAEHNIIKKKDLEGLTGRERADLFHEKIGLACEDLVGEDGNVYWMKKHKNNKYGFLDIVNNEGVDAARGFVNAHLVARNFIRWVEGIGFNEGTRFLIGDDSYHEKERVRIGMHHFSFLLSGGIIPYVEKRLGISLENSNGEYPSYVGRLKGKRNFADELNGRRNLLNRMYEKNWAVRKYDLADGAKAVFAENIGPFDCLDRGMFIKTNGDAHRCAFGILPAEYKFDGEKHVENKGFSGIREAFDKNGGPLGIGRFYGLSEDRIYGLLMDRGPCGICQEAVNS